MARTQALLMLAAFGLTTLAGCLDADGGSKLTSVERQDGAAGPAGPSEAADPAANGSAAPSPAPGENRTESRIKVDPNQNTEGSAHTHDWWHGDRQVEIMSRTINHGYQGAPVCAGNSRDNLCVAGTSRIYLESPADSQQRPNNIYPGTGKVQIRLSGSGQIVHPFEVVVEYPTIGGAPKPAFKVTTFPTVIEIPVEEASTDPPHWRTSRWFFRLASADAAQGQRAGAFVGSLHWQVTIFRSERELPIDPPHPDLWGTDRVRVLTAQTRNHDSTYMDAGVATNQAGYSDTQLQIPKNSTVLPITQKMVVELTWRGTMTTPGTKLVFGYCPPRSKICDGGTLADWIRVPPKTDSATARTFELEIRGDEWDSPYSTSTQWRFRWFFDNGSSGAAVGETGKFQGQVDWLITLYKADT